MTFSRVFTPTGTLSYQNSLSNVTFFFGHCHILGKSWWILLMYSSKYATGHTSLSGKKKEWNFLGQIVRNRRFDRSVTHSARNIFLCTVFSVHFFGEIWQIFWKKVWQVTHGMKGLCKGFSMMWFVSSFIHSERNTTNFCDLSKKMMPFLECSHFRSRQQNLWLLEIF